MIKTGIRWTMREPAGMACPGAVEVAAQQYPTRPVRVVREPVLPERLSADAVTDIGSSPQALAEYIESESAKWSKVVRDAGVELN